MNYIFFFLISISIIAGFINGTLENVVSAMFEGCNLAVKIAWDGTISLIEMAKFTFSYMLIY